MRAHRLLSGLLLVGFVVVGCEGAHPTDPSVSPTMTFVATANPSAADASASPSPSFTADEQQLVEAIRADARVGCAPRRTDLPAFATAGVECTIGSDTVERVGAYAFGPATDASGNAVDGALLAYTSRLAANGVKLGQGDCDVGRNGDRSWPADLPYEESDGIARETRSGCYVDEDRHANVRVTCYGSIYIGVLGSAPTDVLSASRVLRDLYHWAWRVAPDESSYRDTPGICAQPD
jgi:hypothetical protein